MTPQLIRDVLKDAAIVFFDGRLTEAALVLATEAKSQGKALLQVYFVNVQVPKCETVYDNAQ